MLIKLFKRMRLFLTQESATTGTEYAFMIAMISLASIMALSSLGLKITSIFEFEYSKLDELGF